MSEFRQDIITKEWVLIAASRSGRPYEFPKTRATREDLPEIEPGCVFCPGHEEKTPAELARYPFMSKDWLVRVVPNKFSVLELEHGQPTKNFYVRQPGIGSHEVVITRYHNQPTAMQSVELIDLTLQVYADRIKELSKYESVRYVHIIQNHGKLGGASLTHPHSQIFAMPFLGPHVQEELRGTHSHYNLFDECIYCAIMAHELQNGSRIVTETDSFLVFCPFESKMPYQMRILPKRHESNFENLPPSERRELAAVLKSTLLKLYAKLGNPSYNFYIHTMPFSRSKNDSYNPKAYHWHLVIMPRVNIWAGLELGTEIYVNVIPPEHAAEYLRGDTKDL